MKKQEQAALRFSQDELKWAGEIAGRMRENCPGQPAGAVTVSFIRWIKPAGLKICLRSGAAAG